MHIKYDIIKGWVDMEPIGGYRTTVIRLGGGML